ncbi:hypothetical protein K1719_021110 [Acacia pycnantha]|nr:hypothetical protein K1719_021110 [Acacia pycnantha]
MESNLPVISKRVWSILRVVFIMLQKGFTKRKLLMDLNLMLKRPGKLAGKAIANLSSPTTITTMTPLAPPPTMPICSSRLRGSTSSAAAGLPTTASSPNVIPVASSHVLTLDDDVVDR